MTSSGRRWQALIDEHREAQIRGLNGDRRRTPSLSPERLALLVVAITAIVASFIVETAAEDLSGPGLQLMFGFGVALLTGLAYWLVTRVAAMLAVALLAGLTGWVVTILAVSTDTDRVFAILGLFLVGVPALAALWVVDRLLATYIRRRR